VVEALGMMRVRPDVYGSPPDGSAGDTRLDELLGNWATWMQSGTYGQGYPGRTPGLRSLRGTDLDEMGRAVDVRMARVMDALVDSLTPNERLALLRRYGLTMDVWRIREAWDVLEARARVRLRALMAQRRIE